MAGTQFERDFGRDIPSEIRDLEGTSAQVEYEPHFAGEGRFKAFHPDLVRDAAGYHDLEANFHILANYLGTESQEEEITRVQLRAVVDQNILEQIAQSPLGDHVEAVMTFEHDEAGALAVIYIADNSPSRRIEEADEAIVQEIMSSVSRCQPKTVHVILDKPLNNGYQIGILDRLDDREDIAQIVDDTYELYRRFGWDDSDEVANFLTGEDRIFSALRDQDGTIQAVAIALMEHAVINDYGLGINVSMVELTEASSNVSGVGAYAALSELLILELARVSKEREFHNGPIHLVYAESNSLSGPVQAIVNYQGRTRCSQIASIYGFTNGFRLCQQVFIESHPDQVSPKNDLLPNFIPGNELPMILEGHEHYRHTL